MAELNLKQISDKLNEEFMGDVRKLVFWYDDNAEFVEDVDSLELENAKVLHLEKDNQFYIKHFLECEDTTTNYLVYAPFAKPDIRENHLADTILYSKEFFADRASLIVLDLGIDEKYKPLIQNHIKFFANKERMQKFCDLEVENYNEDTIFIAMMSVICKSRVASFDEVMRCILTDDDLENSKYLVEFEKYDLIEAFWKQVGLAFGYSESKPTLKKLIITMFVTYASKTVGEDLPQGLHKFVSYKSGSIIAFVDSMMNSTIFGDRFDEISESVYIEIGGKDLFSKMNVESVLGCDLFSGIDEIIIDWLIARLENEDIGAKLSDKTIPEICAERRKKHFGKVYRSDYFVIENAFYIVSAGKYQYISGINSLIKEYTKSGFKIDRRYRYFYYYLDSLEDTSRFEKLRELIENIYTNEYLNQITVNWNNEYSDAHGETELVLQRNFFNHYVKNSKERTVVIISDAFRYEVACTLFECLQADEKCHATIDTMQGVLPSYTPLGMASLLPHNTIEYSDAYDVLVDENICSSTEQREAQLKLYNENSKCVQFDSLKNMKKDELRSVFTGQEVVYIYHNQIDARGDKASTENEVFNACEEAVEEIHSLMRRLSSQANTHHFIVTADHGFIYKRDKIKVSDKISGISVKDSVVGQRYAISNNAVEIDGVCTESVGAVLGNNDGRVISFPLASDIFKSAGAGQNFVHGGCSPQEMLIPVLDVKVERGKKEISFAKIELVSFLNKITNLITTLDFVQVEPVSDIVKETAYKVYFVSENNEKISNDNIIVADKKDENSTKRIFRLRFSLKNKQYNNTQKYYIVAVDEKNDIEVIRKEVIIDIAFADDFGFLN